MPADTISPGTVKTEDEHRREICTAGRWIHARGFVASTDGNISVRLDSRRILTSPTVISKGLMSPDDMVITDLAMPNMDGLELCRRLRTKTQIPILVLSVRGEERTKVKALDAGADDYVTKPFGIEELLARVRANLRRARPEESELAPIELGDFRIDPGARTVHVQKRAVHLTPKEFDLLVYLARHAGKVVTHRALLGAVWGGESTEQVEYLRVFVGQLRKKLELTASSPRYIQTEPWVGYRFQPGD